MKKLSDRFVKESSVVAILVPILGFLIIYPVGRLFWGSFRKEVLGGPSSYTLANYTKMVANQFFISSFKTTLTIAFEATLMAVIVGVFLAWFVARTDMPFKKIIEPLNLIPFYLSSLVGAVSWEVLAAPRTGLLNKAAIALFGLSSPPFNIYSTFGMSLLIALHYVPFVYLFTVGTLQTMDPSLEDAARASGASIMQTALRVTLPLAAPAILSATLLTFILTAGIFGVPLVLGGPKRIYTLSTLIYAQLNIYPPNYNRAAALSTVLFLMVVILVIFQRKILAKRHFWTVTGKGYRPRLVNLGRARWIALGTNLLYLILTLCPFIMLLFISFIPNYEGNFNLMPSLENYNVVLFVNDVTQRGLLNSITLSTLGATIGVFGCLVLTAIVHRTRIPGRSSVDFIAMLPVTYPGVVLGMGFLTAWVTTPLFGTIWILMIAYMVHFLPTGLRNVEASLGSISPDLDECARVSGASWFGALRKILLPLMMPGLLSTWLLLFVIFMREISSSMMLYVFGNETMGVSLFKIMEYESTGAQAAFGTFQTVLTLTVVFIFRKITSIGKFHEAAE